MNIAHKENMFTPAPTGQNLQRVKGILRPSENAGFQSKSVSFNGPNGGSLVTPMQKKASKAPFKNHTPAGTNMPNSQVKRSQGGMRMAFGDLTNSSRPQKVQPSKMFASARKAPNTLRRNGNKSKQIIHNDIEGTAQMIPPADDGVPDIEYMPKVPGEPIEQCAWEDLGVSLDDSIGGKETPTLRPIGIELPEANFDLGPPLEVFDDFEMVAPVVEVDMKALEADM